MWFGGLQRGAGSYICPCSVAKVNMVLLAPALRAQWLASHRAIWTGKETGSFLTSHSLKQRLVHKVSSFFPNSVSPWTTATDQHVLIASEFSLEILQGIQLSGPHSCYSYTVWGLLICLNPAKLFFNCCAIDLTLFSTTSMKLAFPISPVAEFDYLGLICALLGILTACIPWSNISPTLHD